MTLPMFLHAFLQIIEVVLIDITLSGNNALVISLSAQGLKENQKKLAIIYGCLFSSLIKIGLALIASNLMKIVGINLVGGIILLWICWSFLHDLLYRTDIDQWDRSTHLGEAVLKIIIADFAMSLDNVVAVAGASTAHPVILFFGLTVSIALMVVASIITVRILERFWWLAWIGLALIFMVSLKLLIQGGHDVWLSIAH